MKLDGYVYTNQGGRDYNEDSAAIQETDGHGIYIVADGLGGHLHGEMASACVRDSLIEGWNPYEEQDRGQSLMEQIVEANQKLIELQREQQSTMKSTVVVLTIDEERGAWAHVGDSRLYYIHGNAIQSITEDHSVAFKKYKAGEITREQIAWDEDQSSLLRSLGNNDHCEPAIHVQEDALESGDAFMLCSDGVWEYLHDEEILIDRLKAETAKEWAELLLLRMIERIDTGNDNLTLLTVILT
ncbi:MAG: serine/threonine-protein phosphatase [Lachnospiraceae bacterium]|nr:serine/threonine-protein phosphatase [Lachnospiraceae bacterium]